MNILKSLTIIISSFLICIIITCSDNGSSPSSAGIFARLVINREIVQVLEDNFTQTDLITAFFDSSYTDGDPVQPQLAGSVVCNGYQLVWNTVIHAYRYSDATGPFLQPGSKYVFTVSGSPAVPALSDSLFFPQEEPEITSPAENSTVTAAAGFNIVWTGLFGDEAEIIMNNTETGDSCLHVATDNDGSYTVGAGDLTGEQTGSYFLQVIQQETGQITAAGYDSRSYKKSITVNKILLIVN